MLSLRTVTPKVAPHVKLPRLELKKINGEPSKWTSFWDVFEASIYNNGSHAPIDKFSYLSSLLEGIC